MISVVFQRTWHPKGLTPLAQQFSDDVGSVVLDRLELGEVGRASGGEVRDRMLEPFKGFPCPSEAMFDNL